MTLEAALHVAAAAVALVTAGGALAWRRRLNAGGVLALACLMTAVWAAHVAWVLQVGLLLGMQVLWMPSIGATVGAFYVVVRRTVDHRRCPSRGLLACLVAEPLTVLVCRTVLSDHPLVELPGSPVVPLPLVFGLHTAYCFGLLVLAVLALARRRDDRSPAVRLQVQVAQWGAVGALVAEALRLQVTDVVAAVALTIFTASGLRDRATTPRPTPAEVLDDLGVLVLAFDSDQRVVEWNRPAELFCAIRGWDTPLGATAEELLGLALPVLDGTVLDVDLGRSTASFDLRCHRRFAETGHPGARNGWTLLLGRLPQAAPDRGDSPRARLRVVGDDRPGDDAYAAQRLPR